MRELLLRSLYANDPPLLIDTLNEGGRYDRTPIPARAGHADDQVVGLIGMRRKDGCFHLAQGAVARNDGVAVAAGDCLAPLLACR